MSAGAEGELVVFEATDEGAGAGEDWAAEDAILVVLADTFDEAVGLAD